MRGANGPQPCSRRKITRQRVFAQFDSEDMRWEGGSGVVWFHRVHRIADPPRAIGGSGWSAIGAASGLALFSVPRRNLMILLCLLNYALLAVQRALFV
jgi:hypothetical protein